MYNDSLSDIFEELGQTAGLTRLRDLLSERLSAAGHGDFARWKQALSLLPEATPTLVHLGQPAIEVGMAADLDEPQHQQLNEQLREFHPWRKGPFEIFGHLIDTEWRSDWKWDRLKAHIQPLSGRKVLDIGCGSGYHCWRMRGAGADIVLGIDPTILFVMQYFALQKYINESRVHVLPLGIEDLPANMACFDSVFSMGLLYHRRDPLQHLQELKELLVSGGELILETLVLESAEDGLLVPEGRYAQMRNVWSIPSVNLLCQWLVQAGFESVRCVDVTRTSLEEQRATPWMQFQSLADFLNAKDVSKTVEGYPAPTRAIVLAQKP